MSRGTAGSDEGEISYERHARELTLFTQGSPGVSSPPDRGGMFGSKMVQIGPKWEKSGAFSDQISVHLALLRQMH